MRELEEKAWVEGVEIRTHVQTGRFAEVCLDVAQQEKPSAIYTTRSESPAWIKKLFGSPVDHLIEHAKCPVVVL